MRNVTDSSSSASGKFQRVVAAFLSQPGLPFASVLSAERVERIFGKHRNLFAMQGIFSTVNVLCAFLGQVLRDGKEAACQAAVAAITAQRLADGLATPTADTGDYCRARRAIEVRVVVEGNAREARGWVHLHDARHARKPSGVSAISLAEEGDRVAHRAVHGDSVVGHGGGVGCGDRAVFRQTNR